MLSTTPETRAPIASLSPAQRTAVLECHNGRRLHKLRGFWSAEGSAVRVYGVTVADLVREDLMVTNELGYRKSVARLTTRGAWFARTLVAALELEAALQAATD
jgi:hypothetical protein